MKYIKGKNYQVTQPESILLPFLLPPFTIADTLIRCERVLMDQTLLTIMKGWTWDGASFVLFRWFGTPERWLLMSLVHDALYAGIRYGKIKREHRERIDQLFRDGLITRGVHPWVAQVAYWCVRVGGNFAVRRDVIEREAV